MKIIKKTFPIVIGALAGYAYYYFIGCNSGACLIQSNPYLSTMYGMFAGAAFLLPAKKK
jgi:hypothetical protein